MGRGEAHGCTLFPLYPFLSSTCRTAVSEKRGRSSSEYVSHCHCQVSDSGGETCCGSPTPPWREPALTCSSPSPATILPATCGRSGRRNDAFQPKVPAAPERLLGTSPVSTRKVMNVLARLHMGLEGSGWKYSGLFKYLSRLNR